MDNKKCVNSATVIFERNNGYEASYIRDYFETNPGIREISRLCETPNIGYRFEKESNFEKDTNYFVFYKDSFGFNGLGRLFHSDVVGVEGDIGEKKAKEKCLELLLKDKEILYKTVFFKEKDFQQLTLVAKDHAGWKD